MKNTSAILAILLILALAMVARADGSLSITFTVNTIDQYLGGSWQQYVVYSASISNPQPKEVQLTIGFRIPPYSKILYATNGSYVNGSLVYWRLSLNPYEVAMVEVEFQPQLAMPEGLISFSLLLNGTHEIPQSVNSSIGGRITVSLTMNNTLGLPLTYSVYIPLQNNVNYAYSSEPSGIINIGAGQYAYWSGGIGPNETFKVSIVETFSGSRWVALDLGTLTFSASIDLNYYMAILNETMLSLNNTLARLSAFSRSFNSVGGNATRLLEGIQELAYALNTTALLYGEAAGYVNSTSIIERLIGLQVSEVFYALMAEYRVLKYLNATVPLVRSSLLNVMGNLTNMNYELIRLQENLTQNMIYTYGVVNRYEAIINGLKAPLSAASGLLGSIESGLSTAYSNLTGLYNYVEGLNLNSTIKARLLDAIASLMGYVKAAQYSVSLMQSYVNYALMSLNTAEAQLNAASSEISSRGAGLVALLTNISNSIVKTNQSIYSLYVALGLVGSVLRNSTNTLNNTLYRLNESLGLSGPVYGNVSSESIGLAKFSQYLSNMSRLLMSLYVNMTGQYLLLNMSLSQALMGQEAQVLAEVSRYRAYYAIANGLYGQYLGLLVVNSTEPYTVNIVVGQVVSVKMPVVINVNYIYEVLGNLTSTTSGPSHKGSVGLGLAYLALIALAALSLTLYVVKHR